MILSQIANQLLPNTIPPLLLYIKLISDILDGFDENEMCLIDLQKCIDIIDHTISLEKLKMYGFNGVTLTW